MTIEILSAMIANLAASSGRVMLPSLGVFVCEGVPANFADKGYTILPPYRRLAFHESEGDGTLLYEYYASLSKVSLARAQSDISAVVAQIVQRLDADGQVELQGLGVLKRTVSGSLLFVPDQDLEVSAEWTALEPVSLKRERRPKPLPADSGEESQSAASGEESQSAEEKPAPAVIESPAQAKKGETLQKKGAPAVKEKPAPAVKEKPAPAVSKKPARKGLGAGWVCLIVLLVLLLLCAAAFKFGILYYPEWIDRILYSAEELELLRYFGL